MKIVGLTGSMAMGKSTAAGMLRRLGVPVHDADAAAHGLMARGGAAVPEIETAFPGAVRDGTVDRQTLGGEVFGNDAALEKLEAIIHPGVRRSETAFIQRERRRRTPIAVLDIPLLFETNGESRCDAVIVVSCPDRIQRRRVMARSGMTREKMKTILARQTPAGEKRKQADFVVQTGLGKGYTFRSLRRVLRTLRA